MPVLWKRLDFLQLVSSLLPIAARRSGKLRTTKLGAQTKLPAKGKTCPAQGITVMKTCLGWTPLACKTLKMMTFAYLDRSLHRNSQENCIYKASYPGPSFKLYVFTHLHHIFMLAPGLTTTESHYYQGNGTMTIAMETARECLPWQPHGVVAVATTTDRFLSLEV